VRDSIEKAREKLHDTEQRLGLSQKRMSTLRALSRAMEAAQGNEALSEILEEISGLWESENGV
jgi:predicted DNA-binding protein YlxM (UPF0122 family)